MTQQHIQGHSIGQNVITVGPEREEVYRLIIEFIDTIAHSVAKISRPENVQTGEADGTHPGH